MSSSISLLRYLVVGGCSMCSLQVIRHGDLSIKDVLEIIEIKSIAWPYDADSQFRWMIKNLQANDLHFLLRDETTNKIIAYLNLVSVKADFGIENNSVACWGVGNVCTRYKGKGYGRVIMSHVNKYLLASNCLGLLLCKEPLVGFYSKMGWMILPSRITLGEGIFVMCFGGEWRELNGISRLF